MAVQWYYSREGKEIGPVSSLDLKELATSGNLRPTDHVWKEGMAEWVEAGRITGLFDGPGGQGVGVSGSAAAAGLRTPAGAAVPSRAGGSGLGFALNEAGAALAQLSGRPLRYAFVTLTFGMAAALAVSGVLTLMFLPAFAMGYIIAMRQLGDREQISLAGFLMFLRHGWAAAWHLLMMVAAFFVTLAAAAAPAVLVGAIAYFALGSVDAVVDQIVRAARTSSPQPVEPLTPGDTPSSGSSFMGWLSRTMGKAGEIIGEIIGTIAAGFVMILLQGPVVAAAILMFYLAFDVASHEPDAARPFHLVYDAFSRMLAVARARWGTLVACAILLPLVFVLAMVCIDLFGRLMAWVKLYEFREWANRVLIPLFLLVYMVYAGVFVTRVSLALSRERA